MVKPKKKKRNQFKLPFDNIFTIDVQYEKNIKNKKKFIYELF